MKTHTPVLWTTQSPAHWLALVAVVVVFFPFEWPVTVWPAYALVFDCVFATALAHAIGHTIVFLLAGLLVLNSMPRLHQYPLFYFVMMVLGSLGEEFLKLFILNRWQTPLVSDVRSLSFDTLGFVLAYLLTWGWWRFKNARSVRKKGTIQANVFSLTTDPMNKNQCTQMPSHPPGLSVGFCIPFIRKAA